MGRYLRFRSLSYCLMVAMMVCPCLLPLSPSLSSHALHALIKRSNKTSSSSSSHTYTRGNERLNEECVLACLAHTILVLFFQYYFPIYIFAHNLLIIQWYYYYFQQYQWNLATCKYVFSISFFLFLSHSNNTNFLLSSYSLIQTTLVNLSKLHLVWWFHIHMSSISYSADIHLVIQSISIEMIIDLN